MKTKGTKLIVCFFALAMMMLLVAVAFAAKVSEVEVVNSPSNPVPSAVVNSPSNPVPVTVENPVSVSMERTLVNDGTFFDLVYTCSGTQTAQLEIPEGVVLTDAYVSFSAPETIPNAAALVIKPGGPKYTYTRL